MMIMHNILMMMMMMMMIMMPNLTEVDYIMLAVRSTMVKRMAQK